MAEAPNNDEVDAAAAPDAAEPAGTEPAGGESVRGPARREQRARERAAERAEARRSRAVHRRAWRTKARENTKQRRGDVPPPPPSEPVARPHGRPKVRQGVVVSDKPDKTIVVRIDVTRRHPRYEKIVRSSTTLHAHDERNEANAGDTVRVVESRPLSRTKRWRLVEVLERAR